MNDSILFLIISIATHAIRTIYEILKFRKKINSENKIVFGLIFSNMMVLWISWFCLCTSDPDKIDLSLAVKYIGAIFLISGLLLFIASLVKIKKFENYHGSLITSGIYSYVRHPMYLGFICWIIGGALFYQSLIGLILVFFYSGNIVFWKKMEETHLMNQYPEYQEYKGKTLW